MERSIVTAIVKALTQIVYAAFGQKPPVKRRRRKAWWER
jgi:hypothetical protein